MRRLWAAAALMLAAGGAVAADRPPATVLPSIGPWVVAAEDNLCLLSHGFGTVETKVTLGFQPLFTADNMEVLVLSPDRTTDGRAGDATVTLMPGSHVLSARYVSVPTRDRAHRLMRLSVSSEVLADLATATELTVQGDRLALTFRLPPAGKALQATDACGRELLTEWGVDPSLVDAAHKPVPHDLVRAFGADNYPPEAMRDGVSGRVISILQIDAGGAVTNCRVVASAGDALNTTTCAVARRIRFTPAHDGGGRAVPSIYVLPVRWIMPG